MALVVARFSFQTKQQVIQDAQPFAEISEAHSHGFERVGWLQARIDHVFRRIVARSGPVPFEAQPH
jgi:hypothetical protein